MTSNETAVARHIDQLIEGIETKDLDALRRLYATDVVSFDVEPPLQHAGIDAKLANWAKVFTFFRDVKYEIRDRAVTAGDDVAFAHGFGRLSGTLENGVTTDGMWVRYTICCRKIDGDWLITHDQASVPFDVVSGKATPDLVP
ncbi:YybH family protein [Nocardia inohanensis]|uniref:YybH family protein n=1 Tax=Nocardia inohanensis TaxID=209246 RepID=UPI00082CEFE9|nr:nuclear transport factor 2 family protein [Nocardia inohanensis]